MKVLVSFTTAHGSTADVARVIGDELKEQGLQVVVEDVTRVVQLNDYDAFVLGTPIHAGTWLPEMKEFTRSHLNDLQGKPVYFWVTCIRVMERFGMEHVMEFYMVPEILSKLDVRDKTAFAGKLDLQNTDWNERWTLAARYDGASWPANFDGDFRNWEVIRAWARKVAQELWVLQTARQ
jgi:menaquinone-dependent protoporphyrinogen oxidase